MKILATGITGRMGPAVAAELLKYHQVVGMGRRKADCALVDFRQGDVTELDAVLAAADGCDVILHMAGRSSADRGDDDVVFATNAGGTFNVLEAARRLGMPKLVYASSNRALGVGFKPPFSAPEYVPIDERHRSRPCDPYGISKLACEAVCRIYAQSFGLTVVSLRFAWVLTRVDVPRLMHHVSHPEARSFGLWSWVDKRDAAQAARLAVENCDLQGYQEFLITADDTGCALDSRALLHRFFPGVPERGKGIPGRDSFMSSHRAKRLLGYAPKFTLADGPLAEALAAARTAASS